MTLEELETLENMVRGSLTDSGDLTRQLIADYKAAIARIEELIKEYGECVIVKAYSDKPDLHITLSEVIRTVLFSEQSK